MSNDIDNEGELIPITDVRPGLLLDLMHDEYADPDKDYTPYQVEYAEVEDIVPEPNNTIALKFTDGSIVGFPADHQVRSFGMADGTDNNEEV